MNDREKTIRSFIAIELTDEARRGLAHLQGQLKDILPPDTVRWTPARNIHLTLHFLGDVSADHLDAVKDAIQESAAGTSSFSLSLSDLGCFPNTRRPRILWAGISGDTDLLAHIQGRLGIHLKQAIGFQPESRTYSPHLTIGRVKRGVTKRQMRDLAVSLEKEIPRVGHLATLPVEHIHFIRSDLKPDGPIYTTLAKASFQ